MTTFDTEQILALAIQQGSQRRLGAKGDEAFIAFVRPRIEAIAQAITDLEFEGAAVTLENFAAIVVRAIEGISKVPGISQDELSRLARIHGWFVLPSETVLEMYRNTYGVKDMHELLTHETHSTFSNATKERYRSGTLTYGEVLETDPDSFLRSLGY